MTTPQRHATRHHPTGCDTARHQTEGWGNFAVNMAALKTAAGLLVAAMCIRVAIAAGLVTGNSTPSVPQGLYMRAQAKTADYVSFCLDLRHRDAPFYSHFCSPDIPEHTRILKRIRTRNRDGSLIVEGDTPYALDSRVVGPVMPDQIYAYWQPLIQLDNSTHVSLAP